MAIIAQKSIFVNVFKEKSNANFHLTLLLRGVYAAFGCT